MASEFEATLCASVEVAVDGKHTKTLVHNKLRKLGTKNCWVDFCELLLDEIDVTDKENLVLDEKKNNLSTYLPRSFRLESERGNKHIFKAGLKCLETIAHIFSSPELLVYFADIIAIGLITLQCLMNSLWTIKSYYIYIYIYIYIISHITYF